MASLESEPNKPNIDQQQLEAGVHQLGLLYGINGLQVVTQPGAGWSCAKTERGLIITIDPQQTTEGNGTKAEEGAAPVSPEVTSLFITAHELGHANDFLDSSWRPPAKLTSAESFFDCLVDDTVIDKRNRRVPLLDANADAVYSSQMPSDLTELPKHVQLMFGIRIGTVINNSNITTDDQVANILDGLKEYQKGDQVFNIMDVLTDPRTSLTERRRIADKFVRPYFNALLEEDKQDQTEGDQSKQAGEGADDFDTIYEQYQEAVHGHQQQNDNNEEGDQSMSSSDPGQSNETLSDQIAQAMQQIADDQKAEERAKTQAQAAKAAETQMQTDNEKGEQLSQLAGTVAAEMNLSLGDAESYVRSLDKWTPTIKEVAEVFMKLAAPSDVVMSPRFKRNAQSEGVRLHPRTMAGVALQLATDQEQAIWQPITRQGKRQEVTFGGLDIHLLVDVSGSMEGTKAQCAADTALCLTEGLQLARHQVSRQAGKYHQPDVRTQIIAFGSGTEVLSPLSPQPTGQQMGKTYTNIIAADSSSTLVSGALENVRGSATAEPQRNTIALIISDGDFGDHHEAFRIAAAMPKSSYVAQLVIGRDVGEFITDNNEIVTNPNVLPVKLQEVLANYIRRNQL